MILSELEKIMQAEWKQVRKRFYYPQLPSPRLVKDRENGSINLENLEITISEPFISGFENYDIKPDESLNEVLTHELTHFMEFPGSPLNILRLQKATQSIEEMAGDRASLLRAHFTEAQTNIYMLNDIKHPATAKMRKAYGLGENNHLGRLMYGLYQEVSGQDLGVTPNLKEKNLIEVLSKLDYLNKRAEIVNITRFASVLKEYHTEQNKGSKRNGGDNSDAKEFLLKKGFEGFTENQIREALKIFSLECSNSREFEGIVKQILKEGGSSGTGAGIGEGIFQLAENFYSSLAENYSIPIKKKSLHKNGSLYPHRHTSFEIGDTITDVDAFSSPGILPGITKRWVRKEGESYGNEESIPDSFLIIDNSGSMPSPISSISIPVLGGTAISNAYLYNGSSVAVYSFGGTDHLLPATRDKGEIHKMLRTYTGGGTTFSPRKVEQILKASNKEYDISIISDMDISNLDEFVTTLLDIPQTHRIHLLYTSSAEGVMLFERAREIILKGVSHLRDKFRHKTNVAILPLKSKQDIERITLGELSKSIN